MKIYTFLIVLLTMNLCCSQIKSKPITEFSQKDTNNVVLIDVRTPKEFSSGHLDNAININWFDKDFTKHFDPKDKEKTFYLYCAKGGRSAKATKVLDSLGFKAVNLSGGYNALHLAKKEK